jgi:hypothetical protein
MINRNDFPPILFWRSEPTCTAQRFYIGFCLLMSSIQDTFLGLLQREHNNLNWSATCSYYGLVHAGRLLSFVSIGDFPKAHSELRRLLSPPNPRRNVRLGLDWLGAFTREATHGPVYNGPGRYTQAELYELIRSYFSTRHVEGAQGRLEHFSSIFNAAVKGGVKPDHGGGVKVDQRSR